MAEMFVTKKLSFFGLAIGLLLVISSTDARADAAQQTEIAGHLVQIVNGANGSNEIDILVDGQLLQKDTQDQSDSIYGTYSIPSASIALIEYNSGGSLCPAQFAAVIFGPKISLTKEFGTCSDLPLVSVSGNSLIVTLPDMNDQGHQVDTITQSGVESSVIANQLIGPPFSPGMDLAAMVLGKDILAPFELRATSEEIQSLVGPSVYGEISTYDVGSSISSIGDYVTDDLCEPHNCDMALVHLVFDHKGNVWVATSDGESWKWYGNPPASVIATLASQEGLQASSPVNAPSGNDDNSQNTSADSPQPAAGQNPLPMSSGNWSAMEADGNFAETGSSGQQKIAIVLPQNSAHFEIILTGFESSIPDGTTVSFTVTFDSGQSMSFSGQSSSDEVQANLDDNEVASWTHNLTADNTMSITFSGISEDPWTIPLLGTTPTVTAMAEAIKLAGITGLPAPWTVSVPDSSSDQTTPLTSSQNGSASQTQSQYSATPNNPIPTNPALSDCMAFAAYAFSVTDLSDSQTLFGNYFQVNLASAPDSVFNDLSSFSLNCENQIISQNAAVNGQYPDYTRLMSIFGPGPAQTGLQNIQSNNDQAAQAQQSALDIQKNAALIAGLPSCDDPNTISEIKTAVSNSPAGKVDGISLLGLTSITDITGTTTGLFGEPEIPMGYRVCQADALFNNGERQIDYKLKWFDRANGVVAYSVSGAGFPMIP